MNDRRSQPGQLRKLVSRPSFFEPLERRVLLSANSGAFRPPVPPPSPITSEDIADLKNGPMSNAGPELIELYREFRRFQRAGGTNATFDPDGSNLLLLDQGRVGVTLRGRGTLEQLTDRLRASGAEIFYRSRAWMAIDAMVPIGQLHELARDPNVATMNPMYKSKPYQQGSANNQADFVQRADQVRDLFGVDGSGVTIGVLSDSVNKFDKRLAGSIATGDIPAHGVNIISDSPFPGLDHPFGSASDEGRAMLELIHDIAPGAELQFATANFGLQAFADFVRQLRQAGSDVIVDDIGFFNESWYQPSVIDQAITDVVADGAVYLAAAGNSSAQSGYEALTNWTRVGRNRFVDFDPGPGTDTRLRLTLQNGGDFFMQWDNPYNGVVGNVTADVDVFVYDTVYGRKFHVGLENNIRTGRPIESFFIPAGDWEIEILLADHVIGAELPTRFRLVAPFGAGIVETEHEPLNTGSIIGHNGGEDTISVGAVPFHRPGENEDFSSTGPVTRVFDASGNRLASPITLQKPDISGVDDVNTSFFPHPFALFPGLHPDSPFDDDFLPNFTGTSAAAPNVAAVVALLRQLVPNTPQQEILSALRETAVPLNGSTGDWDPQGGFGLIDAEAAAQRFVSAPTVHIAAVSPNPRLTHVDFVKIVFSQAVVGFDVGDLILRRDGGPNLLTGAQTLRPTDSGRTWMLRELRDITQEPGTYTLTLIAEGSGITNTSIFQNELETGASHTWVRLLPPTVPNPPSDLKAKVIDEGVVRLRWTDNSDNEDRFIIQRAEDPDFTIKTKTFEVPANTTVFTDQVILPVGKRLFYRVRAFNDFSEFKESTNVVEVFLPGPGEIILDNESSRGVLINGLWVTLPAVSGTLGESYLSDLNIDKSVDKNVRFNPNIPTAGDYFVYARWTRTSSSATNVPVDIVSSAGRKQTITVDQRNNGGDGWVLLGKFTFDKGTAGFVRFRTDGTNGLVTVDSIRFQPAAGSAM